MRYCLFLYLKEIKVSPPFFHVTSKVMPNRVKKDRTVGIKQSISCLAGFEEDSLEPTEARRRQSSFDSGLGPSTKTEGSLSSETKTTRKVSHQSSEADSSDAIYCFICDEELGVKLTKGC